MPSKIVSELEDIISSEAKKGGHPEEAVIKAVEVVKAAHGDGLGTFVCIRKATAFLDCYKPAVSAARTLGLTQRAPVEKIKLAEKAATDAAAKALLTGKGDHDALKAATDAARGVYGIK